MMLRNSDDGFMLAGGGIVAFQFGGVWGVLACGAAGIALLALVLLGAAAWEGLRRSRSGARQRPCGGLSMVPA